MKSMLEALDTALHVIMSRNPLQVGGLAGVLVLVLGAYFDPFWHISNYVACCRHWPIRPVE